jgi:hypothetical protein
MPTSKFPTPSGPITVTVDGTTLTLAVGRAAPQPTTRAALRRAYGDVPELWAWLREHGITKPNSGPSGASTPQAGRTRKKVIFTLSDEAREKLVRLAVGSDKSKVVEALIMGAKEK